MAERKKDFDYFAYFCKCADSICEAAEYLDESLANFDHEAVFDRLTNMHHIENEADLAKHEMTKALMHEFLPPIEREDIVELAAKLDDIVDAIEDVMRRMYMFDVKEMRPEINEFTKLIVKAAEGVKVTLAEFKNFKTSKTIRDNVVAVNTIESEGDVLHAKMYHELFRDGTNERDIIIWSKIFDELEDCLDSCESAVDIVELVIMKNS
ncbi:MAG: DUF47 family protein [Clostridiales bacterium]|nr:DUF47 family protein [Clostridiales bacterium]